MANYISIVVRLNKKKEVPAKTYKLIEKIVPDMDSEPYNVFYDGEQAIGTLSYGGEDEFYDDDNELVSYHSDEHKILSTQENIEALRYYLGFMALEKKKGDLMKYGIERFYINNGSQGGYSPKYEQTVLDYIASLEKDISELENKQ